MHRREVWPVRSSWTTHGARLPLLAQKEQALFSPGRPGFPRFCFPPLRSAPEAAYNVLRVPTWPNHTSVPGTHLYASNGTAQATDALQGHVSLERVKRAEAAPVCYRKTLSHEAHSGSPVAPTRKTETVSRFSSSKCLSKTMIRSPDTSRSLDSNGRERDQRYSPWEENTS
jgi:hypothetical protein